jgi:hypothetical protein
MGVLQSVATALLSAKSIRRTLQAKLDGPTPIPDDPRLGNLAWHWLSDFRRCEISLALSDNLMHPKPNC